ncbi:MAG: hypothetical protein ABGY95_05130 [Rubritalea sp.]
MSTGSKSYVGRTLNFMAPLYQALLVSAEEGDTNKARSFQHLSEEAIRVSIVLELSTHSLKN